jgi:hypothetical protein
MITTQGFPRGGSLVFLAVALVSLGGCDQAASDDLVGQDGKFETLSLSATGGMPWPSRDGNECDASYQNVVSVDAASSSITWDTCQYDSAQGHTIIARGTRTTTPAELETIRQALRAVQVGNRGYCGADKASVTLDVWAGGFLGRYVDDFYGCHPPVDGRTFVMNIGQLEYALWALVPSPAVV